MRKSIVTALAAFATLVPPTAFAESGLLVKAGLLGAGIEFVYPTTKFTAVRAVGNAGDFDETVTESDINYEFKLKLRTAGVMFDWHPFGGVFFTSVGLLYNKNEFDATATSTGSVPVGDGTYINPDLKGKITFQSAAPFIGLGLGHSPGGKGLSMAFEVGVMYQGSADVNFTSNVVSQSDLDREAQDLERELDDYKYYPQVALSIGYRF